MKHLFFESKRNINLYENQAVLKLLGGTVYDWNKCTKYCILKRRTKRYNTNITKVLIRLHTPEKSLKEPSPYPHPIL